MKTRTIRQSVTLPAPPHTVYQLLMDSRKHSRLTGAPARIGRTVGSPFSVYDGYATGRNLELIPDAKIVQFWSASDWPDGAVSTITITLTAVPSGCRLTFLQSGIPADHADAIKQGWIDFYWSPMKILLKGS